MNFKECLKQKRYWELMIIGRERDVFLNKAIAIRSEFLSLPSIKQQS